MLITGKRTKEHSWVLNTDAFVLKEGTWNKEQKIKEKINNFALMEVILLSASRNT